MRHLCDANVFLAVVLDAHPHHHRARQWFEQLAGDDTAEFCRLTQSTFLRLLTTEAVCRQHTLTNRQALSIYSRLCEDANVRFCPEPHDLEEVWLKEASLPSRSPKVWNDAYLAAFAKVNGMRLVTFDQGFRAYHGIDLLLLRPSS